MLKGLALPLRHLATGIDVSSRFATNINGHDLLVKLELFCEFCHGIRLDVAVLTSTSSAGFVNRNTVALVHHDL